MAVTLVNVQADCGEIYDATNNGTTAVSSMITLAGDFVSEITGTTTAYDTSIRFMADSLVCNQVLGSVDPVSKTVGNLNIGAKDLRTMAERFSKLAELSLQIKGYSVKGLAVRAKMVNT